MVKPPAVTLSTFLHRNDVVLRLVPRLTYKSQLTDYVSSFRDSYVELKQLWLEARKAWVQATGQSLTCHVALGKSFSLCAVVSLSCTGMISSTLQRLGEHSKWAI